MNRERGRFETKYSNVFRCKNPARCETVATRFANFAGTVENRFLKIKELHPACQQPVN
jgi:hypothetical protein